MKTSFGCGLLVLLLAWPALAKPSEAPLKAAMQLYARHHYTEAARILYPALSALDRQEREKGALSFGMICLANARLYRELYRTSLEVHLDYLTKLVAVDEKDHSHLAALYLAKTLLASGEWVEAIGYFNKFIDDQRTRPPLRAEAQIGLGTAYYLHGRTDAARKLLNGIDVEDPELDLALAAAFSRLSLSDEKPVDMCRRALSKAEATAAGPSQGMISDAIGIYARSAESDAGLALALSSTLKACFAEERLAQNKVIRFYDPVLLDNLSRLYAVSAVTYLQDAAAAADQGVKWPATFHLALAMSHLGDTAGADRLFNEIVAHSPLPQQVKQVAAVHQAVDRFRRGDAAGAFKQLDEVMQSETAAMLSAEILMAGSRHQLEYPPAVKRANSAVGKGMGKSVARVNHALGRYHLVKKDYLRAVHSLEAARDKSNKNRIEFNDPLLLVDLATANYRIKRFSETLETYFEMSKQFPAVRQIQIASQGVYSMEQKSAGDAKIF